jgi:hypothetical protein
MSDILGYLKNAGGKASLRVGEGLRNGGEILRNAILNQSDKEMAKKEDKKAPAKSEQLAKTKAAAVQKAVKAETKKKVRSHYNESH